MRIGLYHGYELTGSGSNEFTRYLAKSLVDLGNEVHILCREPAPESISFLSKAYAWNKDGQVKTLFIRNSGERVCVLHQLPDAQVRPVYLTDKQRPGNVKSFISLSRNELDNYHKLNQTVLQSILLKTQVDILHANHLIYQPVAALEVCNSTATPLVIFAHGSSIEYVIKRDDRYKRLALTAPLGCTGLIVGNREVRDRIISLYPEYKETILAKTRIVGVGVDTDLFKPIGKHERARNIQALIDMHGKGGKTPELTRELLLRLKNGVINATRDYWSKYDHSLPDADLDTHLRQIPWDENILLFVGALAAGKGLQSLIISLPAILSRHPETHLVVVGEGAYREVLEALVYAITTSNKDLLFALCRKGMDLDRSELTGRWEDVQCYLDNAANLSTIIANGNLLEKHVHFVGRLDHPRLKFLFPCADLAVFPSIVPEAYPLVVMESLSSGVIPVMSYFSGLKDCVDELELFLGKSLIERVKLSTDPAERVGRMISTISGLLADPDLKLYGSTLRRIAVENYDWRKRAAQLVQAYTCFIKCKD